eukprot:4270781-Prymnesium_polylepis.1
MFTLLRTTPNMRNSRRRTRSRPPAIRPTQRVTPISTGCRTHAAYSSKGLGSYGGIGPIATGIGSATTVGRPLRAT